MSRRAVCGERSCGRNRIAPMTAAPANTRLTYRHQRQSRYSVSRPPSRRPTRPPAPAMAPYTPNALPRSFGSLNVVVSRDSAAGASSAANAPWQARAVISMAKLTEAPPTAEARAKPMRPVRNVTLRPKRSPRRPPNSSRLPKVSAYAVMTHCRSTLLKCRACCADGSAMFMIVISSTIMSWASPISARISQRRRSGGAVGLAGAAPPGTLVAAMIFSHLEARSPFLARR